MSAAPIVYHNGKFVTQAEATLPLEDRGVLFGQSAYEVVRFYDGQAFALTEHLERFEHSLSVVGIPRVNELDELGALSTQLLERNQLANATVYWHVTRGAAPRSLALAAAASPTPNVFAMAYPQPKLDPMVSPASMRMMTIEDLRWGRCDAKSTMLLPAVLAREEAEANGFAGAILWRHDKAGRVVTESTQANVLFWLDDALRSHPRNEHILAGVSLTLLLELAKRRGLPVVEQAVAVSDLPRAAEIMLSGTSTHVAAVVEVDGRAVGNGTVGPITEALHADLLGEIRRRCAH